MKIKLTDLMDQHGNIIFSRDLNIQEPSKPYLEIVDDFDLRVPFYGGGRDTRHLGYKEVMEKGFVIVAKKLPNYITFKGKLYKMKKMFKTQKDYYLLKRSGEVGEGEYPLNKPPPKLLVVYNIQTRHVRLEGIGAGFRGKTKWIKFD